VEKKGRKEREALDLVEEKSLAPASKQSKDGEIRKTCIDK